MLLMQVAGLSAATSCKRSQAPRTAPAGKFERMNAAYDALPPVGADDAKRDTREVAAAIGASVHATSRALERLVESGRVQKAGTRPAGNTALNLWERRL